MLAGVELDGLLGDVVFLGITVAFFGLAYLLVKLCERISGVADVAEVVDVSTQDATTEARAA